MDTGRIVKVAGPLITATGLKEANMYDVVRVGSQKLIGEILEMRGDQASIQVYEETAGIGPGDIVESTGEPLSVELGPGLVTGIYIPASFSYILSGIRTGWARAWRGLISAEMIFGTTSSGAGIGWFIFMKRTNVDIAGVFAALLLIIAIGIVVEYGVFHTIEKMTLKKWGMSR